MKIKEGVILSGLKEEMRPVLIICEKTYKQHGQSEGVTITSGLERCHSAGSYHYYGYAIDTRTYYFDINIIKKVAKEIEDVLKRISNKYRVFIEKDHLHIDYAFDK